MEIFDPVLYSIAENRFFLDHLGESPVAVMQSPLPKGVQPTSVQEVLGTIYELDELEKHRGTSWIGHQPIQSSIEIYLREWDRWAEDAKRGAPRFPTLYAWDGKGRPHRGGVGADSSRVTTYMDKDGKRQPFRVELHATTAQDFQPSWVKKEDPLPDALVEDAVKGFIQCPLDGWTTNYNPDSRAAYNVARARVARHCKTSKDDRVREFGLKIFG
jgi:hypothetical protein